MNITLLVLAYYHGIEMPVWVWVALFLVGTIKIDIKWKEILF